MANRIRENFKKEVDELFPVLNETYRVIGHYQKNRTEKNEKRVLEQLDLIGERLRFFKPLLQTKKQPYFDAILSHGLSISDRIIAVDIAVGAMHIEFPVQRAYMHKESQQLRKVLEHSRQVAGEKITSAENGEEILIKGI